MRPYCSECVVFGENRRGISRATHMAGWVTGEIAVLCRMHADRCIRAGGVVWPFPNGFECDEEATPAVVWERLHVASVARRDPAPVAEIERAVRDVLPEVLMRVLAAGVRAGGLSPPQERERSPEIAAPGIAKRSQTGPSESEFECT